MANIKINCRTRWIVLTVAAILLLTVGTGVAVAYIIVDTPPVVNLLDPGRVDCEVQENFDGYEKSNVSIKNTGNLPAYIRATYVVTWRSTASSTEIYSRKPVEGLDYTIQFGSTGWVSGDDGYWYYTGSVKPDDSTDHFITHIVPVGAAPDGYSLSVEILASAIQADPIHVVEDNWNVEIVDGVLVP